MRQYGLSCLAALLLLGVAHAQTPAQLSELVQTDGGSLRGLPREPGGVIAFEGIPYAAPPVGDLRWQPPEPPTPWPGERDATQVPHRCYSNIGEGRPGAHAAPPESEDCLTLNVWTGAQLAMERRPVMVWIHGGGFQFGTGLNAQTDGAKLARAGVVLVSLNYRLGVFGFFAHPELRSEGRLMGNFGILDQIAALHWVQANIAKFGGDPANVTIFGESSGSQSVSILMASPLAKGLFQKAIGESGSSLQDLPTVAEMGLRGAAFAGALGTQSIAALRAIPADRVNAADAWDFTNGAPPVFAPAVDGDLMPAQLTDIFRRGLQNDVALLAGYNKREDFPFLPDALPHASPAAFRAAAEHVFGPARMPAFLALYPSDSAADVKASAEALLGDIRQRAETWRWLTLAAQTGKAPVFGYAFSYESPYSPIASHAAEIPFVFGDLAPQFFAPKAPPAGPRDVALSEVIMSYWVDFATKGDPNGADLPHWPPFRPDNALLQVAEDGQITQAPPSPQQRARYRFLDDFLISASMGEP